MQLFCFASKNEKNIWIAVRHQLWAVATLAASPVTAYLGLFIANISLIPIISDSYTLGSCSYGAGDVSW
jgi:hypothetical protein